MVRIPHTKQTKKAVGGSAACLMTLGLVFGFATPAHAQQNRFTPYFRNSDVWVGDVHMDMLARDDASKMVASSRSRGSYCEASQDTNQKYGISPIWARHAAQRFWPLSPSNRLATTPTTLPGDP